jgi:6-hydroxynicotinate 3-monooxygenase
MLSRCIARFGNPQLAFRAYEMIRIPRVGKVQQISIANTWMKNDSDIDWFFGYDPCSAEIADPELPVNS